MYSSSLTWQLIYLQGKKENLAFWNKKSLLFCDTTLEANGRGGVCVPPRECMWKNLLTGVKTF